MARLTLIVGDVQGDYERLGDALAAYPEDEVDTVFLGDFFQGGELGRAGGVAAARMARSRANSRTVLGNHDVFILCVLAVRRGEIPDDAMTFSGRGLEEFWVARRGDYADLEALAADPALEAWLREQPLMLKLDDGTLVQHTDDDAYRRIGASVDRVNAAARGWLRSPRGTVRTARYLIGRRAFTNEAKLLAYLEHFGARRLVHGHTPHWEERPEARFDGRLIGFDGRFSRHWGRLPAETAGPVGATVGLLPPIEEAESAS